MARPLPQARRPRLARRITCQDAHYRTQSVGLWAVPSLGVIVMAAPAAESTRFNREQAISLRAALDEMIAELSAPTV
ncbi:MAG: hypothetical protein M3460_13605 [Actinomycetota bacterium]|nr:hypothetical protein [Actinomycetota bacterium]